MEKPGEIHPFQFRGQRQFGDEDTPPFHAYHRQLPVAFAAAGKSTDAQRQVEIPAGHADPAQDLIQVPDIRSIAHGLVPAEMVQAQFECPFFTDGFLHSDIDPVIDGALQFTVHPGMVLNLTK